MTADDGVVPDARLSSWQPQGGPTAIRWLDGSLVPLQRWLGHDQPCSGVHGLCPTHQRQPCRDKEIEP